MAVIGKWAWRDMAHPIHPSPSYHMCDVAHYAVDPAGFLRRFVDEVHAKALSGENTTVRNPGKGWPTLSAQAPWPCTT